MILLQCYVRSDDDDPAPTTEDEQEEFPGPTSITDWCNMAPNGM